MNGNGDCDVNFKCFCGKSMCISDIVLFLPCNHFAHAGCTSKNMLNNITVCGICQKPYTKIVVEENIPLIRDKQIIINYNSIKCPNINLINYVILPKILITFATMVNKFMLVQTKEDILNCLEFIVKSINLKINVLDNTKKNPIVFKNNRIRWVNKNDDVMKKIIISNHSQILDGLVIYYLFKCGFVASDFITKIAIGKLIAEKVKLLIFKRGEKIGMVEKIKEYLETEKSICLFPEGVVGFNKTLLKFRTGAFFASDVICPIVLKYRNDFCNEDTTIEILNILTQQEIVVDVVINDFETAPYDIDKIRTNMANLGELKLSNASNKNIKD